MKEKESSYMPQLDGLRALCVAAVAWNHWGAHFGFDTKSFPGADIGVETFFVISGFLITGILLDNRSDELRPQVLKQFYIRRFLRIFPVFYVVLGLALLLNVDGARPVWLWHAGYLSNVWFYMHGWGGALSHFWSLAVEEQFYLFWPVFIFMVPKKYLGSAVLVVILIAPVYAGFMNAAHPGVGRVTASVLMPSCLGALGMGAWLAHLSRTNSQPQKFLRWLLVLGIIGIAVWYLGGSPDWLKPLARLALDGVLGWLVFAVARGFGGPVGWFLGCAPLNYLGRISYGIYIIHNFIRPLSIGTLTAAGVPNGWVFLQQTPALGIPVFIALTVGLASLSWHLYEKPLNGLKRHFPYPSGKSD